MAETYYPSPGVTQVQHERLMGGSAASGVFGFPTDPSVIYAPNSGTREIRVRANKRARVEGYGWESDATEIVLTLAANTSGSTRVDLIVLRLDRSDWSLTVKVKQGTPGSPAPAPDYNGGASGVFELPLAEVTVANNATTLASSTVFNKAWYVGSDGQIRCTKDTLPPHEAGRAVWQHPEGLYLVSTGGRWLRTAEDSGATTASMSSGYSASHNIVFRRNGWVFFELSFSRSTTMGANVAYKVATIPAGYRPPFLFQTIAQCPSGQSVLTVAIHDDGSVYVNGGATGVNATRTVVLSAVSWPVA